MYSGFALMNIYPCKKIPTHLPAVTVTVLLLPTTYYLPPILISFSLTAPLCISLPPFSVRNVPTIV